MTVGIVNGNTTGIYIISSSLTPAEVAATITAEQTFTVTGLKVGDNVIVNPPSITAGAGLAGARVSAANTLAITFVNANAAAKTPPAGTYTIVVFRPERNVAATSISD